MLFGLNPNSLYQSYLDTYMDEYNARNQDLGIASLTPVTPVGTPTNIGDGDNVAPPGPPTGNMSLGKGLKTFAGLLAFGPTYGVGLGANKGIESLTGRSLTSRISDAMKSVARSVRGPTGSIGNAYGPDFGSVGPDAVGTAADPSTAASEDPDAIGSQSPGGSESGGNSDGAAAASAAGSNDGPDGGTF